METGNNFRYTRIYGILFERHRLHGERNEVRELQAQQGDEGSFGG